MKYFLGPIYPSVASPTHRVSDNRQRKASTDSSRVDLTDYTEAGSDGCSEEDIAGVSEYPGDVSYVPGKYLHINPHINDSYMWPDAVQSYRCDGAAASLLAGTRWGDAKDAGLSFNACRRWSSLSLTRHRSSILITVCLVVAVVGLGGLTTLL